MSTPPDNMGNTPTSLPQPTNDVVDIPTLLPESAYLLLRDMTLSRENCQLPCFAGIIPGTTSNSVASSILQPLFNVVYGGPLYEYKGAQFSNAGGGRSFFIEDLEISFVLGWLYEPNEERVEKLEIRGTAQKKQADGSHTPIYADRAYTELFGEFGLNKILTHYGEPNTLLAFAYVYQDGNDAPFSNPEQFQLLLIYDRGILVEYMMPLKRKTEDTATACPSEAFINLWLVAPEQVEFYKEMWSSYTTGSTDFAFRLPVHEATGLTLDEFNQTFREPNDLCLETPLMKWPGH